MYNISAQATYEKITFVVRNPLFLLLFYKICKLIENTDKLIFFENSSLTAFLTIFCTGLILILKQCDNNNNNNSG